MKWTGVSIAAALAVATAGPAWAGDHGWSQASDVGVAALMAAAFGTSTLRQDWKGDEALGLSVGATALETWALKETIHERRPNGRNDKSFPSGHTSVSFAAAGYLQERYGWQAGLPAAALATFVGVARVKAHQHHWYDVAAGAALGETTALLLTHPVDSNVRVLPWAGAGGGGVAVMARF